MKAAQGSFKLRKRSEVQAGREATEHARQPQCYSLASPVMEAQYCQLCESLSGHSMRSIASGDRAGSSTFQSGLPVARLKAESRAVSMLGQLPQA